LAITGITASAGSDFRRASGITSAKRSTNWTSTMSQRGSSFFAPAS
jgi:hypothetical protein